MIIVGVEGGEKADFFGSLFFLFSKKYDKLRYELFDLRIHMSAVPGDPDPGCGGVR